MTESTKQSLLEIWEGFRAKEREAFEHAEFAEKIANIRGTEKSAKKAENLHIDAENRVMITNNLQGAFCDIVRAFGYEVKTNRCGDIEEIKEVEPC